MASVKIVAHFLDDTVLKGVTHDFFPNKSAFHIGESLTERGKLVQVADLKAIFFVHDFEGDPLHVERTFFEGEEVHGRKVEVHFKDGELLAGTVLGYNPNRPGYFVVPADERSNNQRTFVVASAVERLDFL